MRYFTVNGTVYDPAAPSERHLIKDTVQARDETHAAEKALLLAADANGLDTAEWLNEPEVSDAPADVVNILNGARRLPGW